MLSCRKIRRRRRERGTPLLQFYASRYRLPGDPSGTRDCLFFPPRPVASLSLCLWIELLSAEPLPELLSMPWCGEAVDVPPLIFVEDRVTAVPTGNLNRLASSRESGDVRSR